MASTPWLYFPVVFASCFRASWRASAIAALVLTTSTPLQSETPMHTECCAVLELRQYTLHPGKRDVLIELFEREFIESQEALGMRIVGQFRDTGNADRFVWLRGFKDMPARGEALVAFYGGPVWQAHRNIANPAMIDAADVLLLRPLKAGYGFAGPGNRPPIEASMLPASRVSATVYLLNEPLNDALVELFENQMKPALAEAGVKPVAVLRTEYAENNFPRLPVRAGEHALVWFGNFDSAAAYFDFLHRLSQSRRWSEKVAPELGKFLKGPPQTLLLEPAARSALR